MRSTPRPLRALEQLRFLLADVRRMTNRRWWRWLSVPFSLGFAIVAVYRIDRACFLLFGGAWPALRLALTPLGAVLRPWLGRAEIHYRSDIGPGLRILHPTLGLVVSGVARLGPGVILTGGNCIGTRSHRRDEVVLIGANADLGANACVIGPLEIGASARIGAGAVVVDDIPPCALAVGVPARVVRVVHGSGPPA